MKIPSSTVANIILTEFQWLLDPEMQSLTSMLKSLVYITKDITKELL